MENSAMLRAFQVLRKKPLLLLLILPMLVVPTLGVAFMPDVSGMLNFNNLMNQSFMMNYQMSNILSLLLRSVLSLVSFVGLFVLIPPAMELLADGAADRETAPGWYTRGLRKHWWKPVVESLIMEAIVGVIVFVLTVVLIVLLIAAMVPMLRGMSGYAPSADNLNALLGNIMPGTLGICLLFGLAIAVVSVALRSFFGLFLPALADRSFGDAFRLMFSRKGLRKFLRMLGGMLLLSFVSSLAVCTFGAVYILISGVPEGPMGPVVAMMNFIKSGAGIASLLLASVIGLLQYPFRFCVFQMIKDEERVE